MWYSSEILPLDIDPTKITDKTEHVFRTKGNGQNKEYFVQWKYYSRKFNSWVIASDKKMNSLRKATFVLSSIINCLFV